MRIKQKDPMISKGGSHEEGTSRILSRSLDREAHLVAIKSLEKDYGI